MIKDAQTFELLDRFNSLARKYVNLAQEIAPKFEKFGKYRKELQEITVELKNRGVDPEEPEDLLSLVQELIKERNEESDTMERRSAPVEDTGQINQ